MSPLQHEIGKRTPFDSAAQEAYLNLLRTSAALTGPFDRLFRERGLSEPTYNILRILRGHGAIQDGIPCQTIGEQLVSRLPDVTRLLDRLEAAGLVQRARSARDRRVVLVSITKKGLSLLADLDRPTSELHRRQLAHMTRAELSELNRLLDKARQPDRR